MKKIFAGIVAAVLFSTAAYAQSAGTVTNHAFAIGKGPGVTGYASLFCTTAQLAVGQAAADPICRTITGDWTLNAAGVSALATVNANVGSFGSATQCVTFTTNGKGLITAASQTACTAAIGSVSGLGAGVATALGVNVGTAGAFVVNGGALGTPSSGVATNLTGAAAGLTAGNATLAANVTTNANLTGPVTSVGNATTIGANQVTRANEAQGVARSVVGVTGNATANVADIQGTASQFLGVNAAGTALAFQTMSSDATLSGGAINVTGINGVNQNAAWTTYAPTVTCGGGTPAAATASGRYKQIGKSVLIEGFISVFTIGTCTGNMRISTPITAAGNYYAMSVFDTGTGATGSAAIASADGTAIRIFTVAGAFPTGFLPVVTGVYEVP